MELDFPLAEVFSVFWRWLSDCAGAVADAAAVAVVAAIHLGVHQGLVAQVLLPLGLVGPMGPLPLRFSADLGTMGSLRIPLDTRNIPSRRRQPDAVVRVPSGKMGRTHGHPT